MATDDLPAPPSFEVLEAWAGIGRVVQIKALDPPADGDGDHSTHFWPGVLDRWLH
ncbi:hypothetical protein AB0H83_31665 [Dactylosporangium sp. NPDC050688]|uniref:hypothetical protein n=1 Tax=Dactylosporangium sp. NPDC050688 TaxID=3157217 RepID=UPI0033D45DF7